jgi:hypothetical protein
MQKVVRSSPNHPLLKPSESRVFVPGVLELVATLSGEPLFGAYGFTALERIEVSSCMDSDARLISMGRRWPITQHRSA